MRVLVVEDDPKMADVLQRALRREGYVVALAATGEEALWSAREVPPDIVLLDAMIPEPDGFEVCRRLRAESCWAPVILVTGRGAVPDRVAGLDAGADDYLVKPFALAELHARIRALLRRDPAERPQTIVVGDLSLDPARRQVSRAGTSIDLTPTEYGLLELLMRRPGDVVSRTDILDHVWDVEYEGTSNVVNVYIGYLRAKIDRPFDRDSIETVRGHGYRLRTP